MAKFKTKINGHCHWQSAFACSPARLRGQHGSASRKTWQIRRKSTGTQIGRSHLSRQFRCRRRRRRRRHCCSTGGGWVIQSAACDGGKKDWWAGNNEWILARAKQWRRQDESKQSAYLHVVRTCAVQCAAAGRSLARLATGRRAARVQRQPAGGGGGRQSLAAAHASGKVPDLLSPIWRECCCVELGAAGTKPLPLPPPRPAS